MAVKEAKLEMLGGFKKDDLKILMLSLLVYLGKYPEGVSEAELKFGALLCEHEEALQEGRAVSCEEGFSEMLSQIMNDKILSNLLLKKIHYVKKGVLAERYNASRKKTLGSKTLLKRMEFSGGWVG